MCHRRSGSYYTTHDTILNGKKLCQKRIVSLLEEIQTRILQKWDCKKENTLI